MESRYAFTNIALFIHRLITNAKLLCADFLESPNMLGLHMRCLTLDSTSHVPPIE